MNTHSCSTSGRRGSCPPAHRHAASFARRVGSKPGQALQDPRRPHAVSANESAPGASRRPFRKPGQALPPPTGPSGRVMRMVRWPLVALLCAFLVIAGAPSSVADPSPDPDLAQSVAAHEEW